MKIIMYIKTLPFVLIVLYLSACSPEKDAYEPGTFESIFTLTGEFILPDYNENPVEGIHLTTRLNDSELLFLTSGRNRRLFLFNEKDRVLRQIGRQGQGPGEYTMPAFISVTDDGRIAFSDAGAGRLTILDAEVNYMDQINIPFISPSPRFAFGREKIYLHGTFDKNLFAYNKSDEVLEEIFSSDEDYFEMNRRFDGGGVIVVEDTIYWVNSFEPWIYRYPVGDESFTRIVPEAWKEFTLNHDRSFARTITTKQFNRVSDQLAKLNRFDLVYINGSPHFTVAIQRGNARFLHILNTEGELICERYYESWYAGASGPEVYFSDVRSTNGDFEVVLKVYSVR